MVYEDSNLQTDRYLYDHSQEPNFDPHAISGMVNMKKIKKTGSMIETLPLPTQSQAPISPPVIDYDGRTPDLPFLSPSLTKFISHDFSAKASANSQHQYQ